MRRVMLSLVIASPSLGGCTSPESQPPAAGPATFGLESPEVAVLTVGDGLTSQPTFYDSTGTAITSGTPAFESSDARVATVDARGRVQAVAPGEVAIRATRERAAVSTHLRVVASEIEGPVIDVFPTASFQVMTGWEASGQLGEIDCDPKAYEIYKDTLVKRVVNELGITRLRLSARSGTESRADTWIAFRAGRMNYPTWRRTWFVSENDNDDPRLVNPAGFQWGFFDYKLDAAVAPIRKLLEARGEKLYINLNFVDFYLGAGSKAFPVMKDPEEYAEFITEIFNHMKARVGYVPDGVELNLEPEHTPYTGEDMGRALVAVARRLKEAGYTPEFLGPSNTKASNVPLFYDAMMRVPGARGLIAEIAYHKYSGVSNATLRAILVRARRDGTKTAMLEHIGSGFDGLYEDLTIAQASSWEQFTLAYCGRNANPDNAGVFYHVNLADSANPSVGLTREGRLLRQVFVYARPGAVRLGAMANNEAIQPLAFRNANGKVVAVARTRAAGAFTVRGLPAGTYGVNYSTRLGRYNIDVPDVTVSDGGVATVKMPAAGAFTLYAR
jgi:hypothetical protein